VRGVRRTHHGQQGPKRCLVGNTETMKRMGRAGRVNVKRKEAEIARANRPNAAAQTDRCAQKNKKLRQNVLDGADFVRDVIDTYDDDGIRCTQSRRLDWSLAMPSAQKLDTHHKALTLISTHLPSAPSPKSVPDRKSPTGFF
jgi:hypothetical protein